MKSELKAIIVNLYNIEQRIDSKIAEYYAEYEMLEKNGIKNFFKLQKLNRRLDACEDLRDDIYADLKDVMQLEGYIRQLENLRDGIVDTDKVEHLKETILDKKRKREEIIESLKKKYSKELKPSFNVQSLGNHLFSYKKKLAGLFAGMMAFGLVACDTKNVSDSIENIKNENPTESVDTKIEDSKDINGIENSGVADDMLDLDTSNNTLLNENPFLEEEENIANQGVISNQESLTFTDINDEEQVYRRASEFISDIDAINPGHDHSVEEVENISKWINNGDVEEVSQEAALFAVTRLETLWNRENQKEVSGSFDISKLFLDGTRGQRLAKKIYDIRVSLQNAESTEAYRKYAEEFTVLLVNSWVLDGTNNEISAYELETSFMEAVIDKYFLNTYAMINAKNINVTVNDVRFNLDKVADEINNNRNCNTKVIADDGKELMIAMDKFSSDMIGAVSEATNYKNENNSLKLS